MRIDLRLQSREFQLSFFLLFQSVLFQKIVDLNYHFIIPLFQIPKFIPGIAVQKGVQLTAA